MHRKAKDPKPHYKFLCERKRKVNYKDCDDDSSPKKKEQLEEPGTSHHRKMSPSWSMRLRKPKSTYADDAGDENLVEKEVELLPKKKKKQPGPLSFQHDGDKMSLSKNNKSGMTFYDPSKPINPFTLCDLQPFPDGIGPPFIVDLALSALAIMDIHSQCQTTEVIGCLGGYYCRTQNTLHIVSVEPCILDSVDSTSSTCEVDPVALVKVVERLRSQNLQLVGWYHSHPTFPAIPSVRDIESQDNFQMMFSNSNNVFDYEGVGIIISPFAKKPLSQMQLGPNSFTRTEAIVNSSLGVRFSTKSGVYPYLRSDPKKPSSSYYYFSPEVNAFLASEISCFYVGGKFFKDKPTTINANLMVPYKFDMRISRDETLVPTITNIASKICKELVAKYSKFRRSPLINLFDRATRVGSICVTYLERINASLAHHFRDQLVTDFELDQIKHETSAILVKELQNLPSKD